MWRNNEDKSSYKKFIVKNKIILLLFIVLFVLLSIRLFFLQIINGNKYAFISERQRLFSRYEHAPRGVIYSADNIVLAENKFSYAVLFYTNQNQKKLINHINNIPGDDVNFYVSNNVFTKLIYNLSMEDVLKILESKSNTNNFMILKESHRIYHKPKVMSHIIGYISEIKHNELKQFGYHIGDYIGRGGIEQYYDQYLKGQSGELQIEVNAKGNPTKVFQYISPSVGADVYSTIDFNLQQVAYNALKNSTTGIGAVVVLDIKTGAIKALVSCPGFNLNKMGIHNEFKKYCLDKRFPFFNRAIQAVYSPGSIFKIITFIASMEILHTKISQKCCCPGYFQLGNRKYVCWCKSGHGIINLINATALSCNVYFYQLGIKLGIYNLIKYAKTFFLGTKTGIDLPNEKSGFIPSPRWKHKHFCIPWFQGDTAIFAVGQGALGVTVLQMAYLIAGIANHGVFYEPYIVDRIVKDNVQVFKHRVKFKKTISINNLTYTALQTALLETVEYGTGRRAQLQDIKIAGKTGTAQNNKGKPHAWFVSYAPTENPKIAVAVLIENGGSGGMQAVPISKKIYQSYFKIIKKNE
ncbi:MAG: penicillin-binding protein 2 [Endomicrobium sp.]|jgi:penicillin-binding protein 2|nr:penicillin-binding protein 2 [Endomicrobium sp.]